MADIITRTWRSGPRRVKRIAWGYSLWVNGKRERQYNSAWTEAEQALAARILGQSAPDPPLRAERSVVATRTEPDRPPAMTFGQAIEKYLAVKTSEQKRSIRDDRQHLARLEAAFGGAIPLEAITASLIAGYKVERMQTTVKRDGKHQPIAPATLNRELASLRHLLRLAVEEWQVLPALPKIKLLREPEGRLRFLSEEEIVRLLDVCRRSLNPYLTTIVTVAINTGMRQGELMRLRWEDVDVSRGVLMVRKSKSGKRREIPMNEACDAALQALPGSKIEGPVFCKASGARWGSIRTAWDGAFRLAKLEDVHFHDLRHTFASHMIMRGATLVDVKELLGHADIKLTMRYAHLSPGHRRTAVDKLVDIAP